MSGYPPALVPPKEGAAPPPAAEAGAAAPDVPATGKSPLDFSVKEMCDWLRAMELPDEVSCVVPAAAGTAAGAATASGLCRTGRLCWPSCHSQVVASFKENAVSGADLEELTDEDLQSELKLKPLQVRDPAGSPPPLPSLPAPAAPCACQLTTH